MTRITEFGRFDADLADEEFYGPPPRFLCEPRPKRYELEAEERGTHRGVKTPALSRIKEFVAGW